ncbi:MAG TPA: hypothetical protein VKY19_24005 [Ktedonosporobacter sp.]|jgi:hypothetical protein|nr:hypothetical protein [Ktedonosporobacter sp.]
MASIAPTRPRGLIIVIIIQVLTGLLSFVGGVTATFLFSHLPPPQGLGFLQILAPVFPMVMTFLGIFFFITSYALWKGYKWGWTATIVFNIIHIVVDFGFIAARSFSADKIVGLVFIVGTLLYLFLPGVRAYFAANHLASSSSRRGA